jgi:type II secretory ATPase GspE/PulE/Tfp pilus assembly ATPase PilB-like protein
MSQPIDTLGLSTLTLAQNGLFLVSIWKPLLLLIPIVGWAWIIAKIYDKHAAQFFLPRRKWNTLHMGMGMLALAAGLGIGVLIGASEGAFWAGFGAVLVILATDVVIYAVVANKDERVPDKFKIRLNMATIFGERPKKVDTKGQAKVALAIKGMDEKGKYTIVVTPPQAETPEYEVRTAAEQAWIAAGVSRATQFDIGPAGKDGQYGVSYLVDGVRQAGEVMPAANAARIMDFWKAAARLDVADRRRKQTGNVQVSQGSMSRVARVTSIGAQGGMRLTVLFDPETSVQRKPEDLGLLEPQLVELKNIIAEGKGVVLLAAPPDGGRTTTLYTITRMHDAYTTNVQTCEIDPQSALEGVRTNVWDPQKQGAEGAAGAEFSTTVRSILRRDPDVVSVGELPDANTAKEISKADHERTRVYVSLRAADALMAIQMYVKAVGDTKLAADSLHGVVAQRLVRKLCSNCRVAYPPTPDMLKKMGIPEGKVQQLYRKGGQVLIKNRPETCPVCNGGGYFGQEGLFEVYSIGPEERSLIAQGNFQGLRAALRKRQLPSIQQVALRKAVDGTTSVEEVMRVTAEGKTEGGQAAPAAAAPAATA